MAREIRCILFDRGEIRAACTEYLTRRRPTNSLPDIAKIDLTDSAIGPGAQVQVRTPAGIKTTILESLDYLEAILMFCTSHRIPLPRRATKALQGLGENVVLVISDNVAMGQPTVALAANQVRYTDPSVRRIALGLLDPTGKHATKREGS